MLYTAIEVIPGGVSAVAVGVPVGLVGGVAIKNATCCEYGHSSSES